jgi:predicted nucleic acid-binding protein
MIEVVVADTCSFRNFAAVRRLDLLDDMFGARIRCAEAVRQEILEQSLTAPELVSVLASPWLKTPITFDDQLDIAAIERLRRTELGGRARLPRQHLGEAQSLNALITMPSLAGAILLTDDAAAVDYARHKGLSVIDSADVMSEAYERDLVGCPEAYDVLLAMRVAQRGVRVPTTHFEVCPPVS